MANDLMRGDVNWFDGRHSQRRSAKASGRRKTVATARDERRRLITLGLMMTFASLAAQSNPRCSYRLKTEDYEFAPKAASLDGYRSRNHLGPTVDLPRALPEARGLGVPVRRRQCKDCRRFRCLCVFWRFAPSGDGTPRRSSLHPISLVREGDGYRFRFPYSRGDCHMFKRSAVHYGRTPEPVTPYQSAAQVWDERIGAARVQAKNWRLMAFGCLFLTAGLAARLVWHSAQGTITPWVVEVDRQGQAQTVAPANPVYEPTDVQIAFHLARFIEHVRGLPMDAIVLRQDWLRAYDFTTDRGAAALNDYARGNDPFAKLGKIQVAVDVSSVIRASPDSFRVAWTERRYDNGQLAATDRWTAILTIVVEPPRDVDRLRKNPLGIYVNAINWSKELGQ
jgi:type IV secretory pathway TrbF-like protein